MGTHLGCLLSKPPVSDTLDNLSCPLLTCPAVVLAQLRQVLRKLLSIQTCAE